VAAWLLAATVAAACGGQAKLQELPSYAQQGQLPSDATATSDAALSDGVLADGATPTDATAVPDLPQGNPDYTGPACTTENACKSMVDTPYCAKVISQCVACLFDLHCQPPKVCKGFQCVEVSCKPSSTDCEGGFLATCREDGKGYDLSPCPPAAPECVQGACKICEPGKTFCAKPEPGASKSMSLLQCNSDGTATTVAQACKADQACQAGKCQKCVPLTKSCDGDTALQCKDDGSALEKVEDCSQKGLTCLAGQCVNACDGDIKSKTHVGCDYWAVDLDNAYEVQGGKIYDAQNAQFAVIVSNTTATTAQVTVTLGPDKTDPNTKTKIYTVAGKALQVIKLPDPSWGLKPQNQDGTSINKLAYRIRSSQPIVAYQFNPLQNYGVFSNDASLLIPTTAVGKEYWVLSRAQLGTYRGYVTVVATQPGKTLVTFVSSAVTLAGKDADGQPIPAMKKGEKKTFTLYQGEVLNIETNDTNPSDNIGEDLTGSYVSADRPVVVFGGSEASNSPTFGNCVPSTFGKVCASTTLAGMSGQACSNDQQCKTPCCADHLEEQMFPVESLGTHYVAARLWPRGKEKDAWRVLAVQNGTKVTITPDIGVSVPTLNQGQWYEFETTADFVIESDKPLLVGQYMASSYATVTKEPATCQSDLTCAQSGFTAKCEPGGFQKFCAPIGDPSLLLGIATTQYLPEYRFLVPAEYVANYVSIIAPQGAQVELDGTPLLPSNFKAIGSTGWTVAKLPAAPGTHHLASTKKIGLYVYGYDDDVSYGYAGGALLEGK
jgi:hypothetical protein